MNKKVKKLLVKALKTGIIDNGKQKPLMIKQGKDSLRPTRGKMCCLGVLCEIYRRETGLGKWIKSNDGYHFDKDFGTLPGEVVAWAELKDSNPDIQFGTYEETLSELNDSEDIGFVGIAKLISRNL